MNKCWKIILCILCVIIICVITGIIICGNKYESYKNNLPWEKVKLSDEIISFIKGMPKTALHMHIEGSLEADLAWKLAINKNPPYGPKHPLQIPAPSGAKAPNIKNGKYQVTNLKQLKEVYNFNDLESFLNVYNTLATLLETESDFTQLAKAYGKKCLDENIRHAEIFFDPQTHLSRGIPFKTVVTGIQKGLQLARSQGLNIQLIVSILRDHKVGTQTDGGDILSSSYTNDAGKDPATAWVVAHCTTSFNKLTQLSGGDPLGLPAQWKIVGVGLDNNEVGYPPGLFAGPYKYLRDQGLFCVAHAGEEGPPSYIWDAIKNLKVIRVDHGVRSVEDPNLIAYMQQKRDNSQIITTWGSPHDIPVTVCPLSNYKLKVFSDPTTTNIIDMLDLGMTATVNSDDPAYFGGYVSENYLFLLKALDPSVAKDRSIDLADIFRLAKNGFNASVINDTLRQQFLSELINYFLITPGTLYRKKYKIKIECNTESDCPNTQPFCLQKYGKSTGFCEVCTSKNKYSLCNSAGSTCNDNTDCSCSKISKEKCPKGNDSACKWDTTANKCTKNREWKGTTFTCKCESGEDKKCKDDPTASCYLGTLPDCISKTLLACN